MGKCCVVLKTGDIYIISFNIKLRVAGIQIWKQVKLIFLIIELSSRLHEFTSKTVGQEVRIYSNSWIDLPKSDRVTVISTKGKHNAVRRSQNAGPGRL